MNARFVRLFAIVASFVAVFVLATEAGAVDARVAFIRKDGTGTYNLFVQTIGQPAIEIAQDVSSASWTPEGTLLFVNHASGVIHEADDKGKNVRSLDYEGTPVASENVLAFAGLIGNSPTVFAVLRSGGKPIRLGHGSGRIAISPDEQTVVFDGTILAEKEEDDFHGFVSVNLASVLAGEKLDPKPLFEKGEQPVFLRDGRLVYVNDHPRVPEIRIRNLETKEDRLLVSGARVYYVTKGGQKEYVVYLSDDIHAISPEGGSAFKLPFEKFGDVYGDVEGTRAIEPRGKIPTLWGKLKRR